MSVLPLLDLDKVLALEAENFAILIENHTQPAALHLAFNRAELAIILRRLAQPLHAHAHYTLQLGLAVECSVSAVSPDAVLVSGSGVAGSNHVSFPKCRRCLCLVGAHARANIGRRGEGIPTVDNLLQVVEVKGCSKNIGTQTQKQSCEGTLGL